MLHFKLCHFLRVKCVSLSHKYIPHHTTAFTAFSYKKNTHFRQAERRDQEKELNARVGTSWNN